MPGREPTLIELEFAPLVGDGPQPFQKANGFGVEVHKNEFAEGLAANALKTSATEIQVTKIFRVFDGFELTIQ